MHVSVSCAKDRPYAEGLLGRAAACNAGESLVRFCRHQGESSLLQVAGPQVV